MIVFFGHQSVGANLIQGLGELGDDHPFGAWHVTRLAAYQPTMRSTHVLIHERLGENRNPSTKLDAFQQLFASGMVTGVDVALLKFCYVDVSTRTEAESLRGKYEACVEQLTKQQDTARLAHVTIPLRQGPHGIHALLGRALGRRHREHERNRAREGFNDWLRARYASTGTLFDLALLESTRRNGRRHLQRDGADLVPCLAPEWTYDGGHLNESGRSMAARAFLQFLHAFGAH
jgi:hypothetical protein